MLSQSLFFKFKRFFVTGGISSIVDTSVFSLLIFEGIRDPIAAIISFCLAAIVNFILTSHFVFAMEKTGNRFISFMIFAIIGLLINVNITIMGIYYFGLMPVIAKILGIGVAFPFNFFMNAYFVFRKNKIILKI